MRGVLYVPGLGIHQYSIGHATAASLDVLFTNNSVSFSRDGVVIMEGRRSEEKALYHLDIEVEEHYSKTERALTATQGFVKWQRILCSFARLLCCQIYQKIIKMRLNSDFRRYWSLIHCDWCIQYKNARRNYFVFEPSYYLFPVNWRWRWWSQCCSRISCKA